MPGSFVELRHEATHEDLPSLRRLQMATEQALQWLWHHYWSKLDASLSSQPENRDPAATEHWGPDIRGSLHRIFKTFVSARRDEIKKEGPKSGVESRSVRKAMDQLDALGATKRPALFRDEVISLLLADRMVVPSDVRWVLPQTALHAGPVTLTTRQGGRLLGWCLSNLGRPAVPPEPRVAIL